MPIELSDLGLTQLSAEQVEARLLRLENQVEGRGVGVEIRYGVVHDLVLRLHSILGQALSDRMDQVGASLNPLLTTSGAAVESDVLDQAVTYYGLSRYEATNSRGTLAIVLSTDRTVLIPAGATFTTADGRTYIAEQAFAARTSASEVRSETDRFLTRRSDGNYEFTVEAVATTSGSTGSLAVGTELQVSTVVIPAFVMAYAKTAFSGGVNSETDAELLTRVKRQLPAKSLSTRASVAAYLTQSTAIPTLRAVSTIGFGDAELRRGQRLGMCGGAAADIYLRSTELPVSKTVRLVATVVAVVPGSHATWQVVVDRDVAPGFYLATRMNFAEGSSLSNIAVERGVDTREIVGEQIPRVSNPVDAAFSRFQTATLRANSPSAGITLGDTAEVDVELLYAPDIDYAQRLVSSREYRFIGGDTLVRAAVPVFVSVSVQIHALPGVSLPEANTIRAAVANYFNTAGFPGRLHTSRLASIVHGFLPSGADVGSIDVILETLRPDGTVDRRRQTGHVDTLHEPLVSTTARTCTLYCDPSNVVISAYEESSPSMV